MGGLFHGRHSVTTQGSSAATTSHKVHRLVFSNWIGLIFAKGGCQCPKMVTAAA